MSDEEVPAEVIEGINPSEWEAQLGQIGAVLRAARGLDPHAEQLVRTYAGLLIQVGEAYMGQFKRHAEQQEMALSKIIELTGVIIEQNSRANDFFLRRIEVEARERMKEKGIETVGKVVEAALQKLDPELVAAIARAIYERWNPGANDGR